MSITAETWDCVIVGAGPSGSATAISAARAGLSVLLVDKSKFPRDKICGCCLNEKSISSLSKLNVLKNIDANYLLNLKKLELSISGRNFIMDLSGHGLAISRPQLDQVLVDQAKQLGVTAMFETKVSVSELSEGYRTVELRTTNQLTKHVRTKSVVIAIGLYASNIFTDPREQESFRPTIAENSYIGIGTKIYSSSSVIYNNSISMSVTNHGYIGITRLEDDTIDIAGAIDPVYLKKHDKISDAVLEMLGNKLPDLRNELITADWRGTPALTRHRTFNLPAVYITGDAIRYVEPFTGEGISWALESGILLGNNLKTFIASSNATSAWEKLWQENIGKKMITSKLISRLLRYPNIVSFLLSIFFKHKITKNYLCRLVNQGNHELQAL